MARTSTAPAPAVHKVTGLPVAPAAQFSVGDLVTEHIGSDAYPAVVVAVQAKAVFVRKVNFVVGNATEQSWANYLDDTTIVIDPQSVEDALALGLSTDEWGQGGPTKYLLQVSAQPDRGASYNERERVGHDVFHRAAWRLRGGYGGISAGARYRQDPHF